MDKQIKNIKIDKIDPRFDYKSIIFNIAGIEEQFSEWVNSDGSVERVDSYLRANFPDIFDVLGVDDEDLYNYLQDRVNELCD